MLSQNSSFVYYYQSLPSGVPLHLTYGLPPNIFLELKEIIHDENAHIYYIPV